MNEWSKPYAQAEHMLMAAQFKSYVQHALANERLFNFRQIPSLTIDTYIHNVHLNLARQGEGAIFSLNMRVRRKSGESR